MSSRTSFRWPQRRTNQRSFKRIAQTVVGAALGALLSFGCDKTNAIDVGGETHFLTDCNASCPSGMDCIGGLCTRSCSPSSSTCETLASGAVCVGTVLDAGVGSVCDVPCTNDTACSTVSSDHRCQAGVCRVPDSTMSGVVSGDDAGVEFVNDQPDGSAVPSHPINDAGANAVEGEPRATIDAWQGGPARVQILGEGNSGLLDSAFVGDLDADGFDDFLVFGGANVSLDLGVNGSAYLFYGGKNLSAHLQANEADLILRGATTGTGVGDVNGDGYDDFAFVTTCDQSNCGLVNGLHVVYGKSERYSGTLRSDQVGARWVASNSDFGPQGGSVFYTKVSAAGDVNADGYGDILVDAQTNYVGVTYLLLGRAEPLDHALVNGAFDAIFKGGSGLQQIQSGSTGTGDINGDGYADILIAVGDDDAMQRAIALFYGGSNRFTGGFSGADADAVFNTPPIGFVMHRVGDLDQDGYDDLALPSYDGEYGQGFIPVIYGRSQRFSGSYDLARSAEFSLYPGSSVDGLAAGDINGDGWLDLIVGDSNDQYMGFGGALSIVPGGPGRLNGAFVLNSDNVLLYGQAIETTSGMDIIGGPSYLGYGTSTGGDVNGDGFDDALVTDTGNGPEDDHVFLLLGSPSNERSCLEDSQCGECHTCDINGGTGMGLCIDAPQGTACGSASDSECDNADTCDATGSCQANLEVQGAPCGNADDPCTVGACDGVSPECPRQLLPECTTCSSLLPARPRLSAVASSVTGDNIARLAIDGSATTRWESAQGASADPSWIYVDLGLDTQIEGVLIDWEAASAMNYLIQIAPNGTCAGTGPGCLSTDAPWVTAFTSPTYTVGDRTDNIALSGVGRYVRMYGTARTSQYGYSIEDFNIFSTSLAVSCLDDSQCGECQACNIGGGVDAGTGVCVPAPAGTPCSDDGDPNTPDVCDGRLPYCPRLETCTCQSYLLRRASAVASSTTGSNGARLAIDNSQTSYWDSVHGKDNQWIYVDLGANVYLDRVVINWQSASARTYSLSYALDGSLGTTGSWHPFFSGDSSVGDRTDSIPGPRSVGRYLRMYGVHRTTDYGFAIEDFAVYGDSNAACFAP